MKICVEKSAQHENLSLMAKSLYETEKKVTWNLSFLLHLCVHCIPVFCFIFILLWFVVGFFDWMVS